MVYKSISWTCKSCQDLARSSSTRGKTSDDQHVKHLQRTENTSCKTCSSGKGCVRPHCKASNCTHRFHRCCWQGFELLVIRRQDEHSNTNQQHPYISRHQGSPWWSDQQAESGEECYYHLFEAIIHDRRQGFVPEVLRITPGHPSDTRTCILLRSGIIKEAGHGKFDRSEPRSSSPRCFWISRKLVKATPTSVQVKATPTSVGRWTWRDSVSRATHRRRSGLERGQQRRRLRGFRISRKLVKATPTSVQVKATPTSVGRWTWRDSVSRATHQKGTQILIHVHSCPFNLSSGNECCPSVKFNLVVFTAWALNRDNEPEWFPSHRDFHPKLEYKSSSPWWSFIASSNVINILFLNTSLLANRACRSLKKATRSRWRSHTREPDRIQFRLKRDNRALKRVWIESGCCLGQGKPLMMARPIIYLVSSPWIFYAQETLRGHVWGTN